MIPDTPGGATSILEKHTIETAYSVMCTLEDSWAVWWKLDRVDEEIADVQTEGAFEVAHSCLLDLEVIAGITNIGVIIIYEPGFDPCIPNIFVVPSLVEVTLLEVSIHLENYIAQGDQVVSSVASHSCSFHKGCQQRDEDSLDVIFDSRVEDSLVDLGLQ